MRFGSLLPPVVIGRLLDDVSAIAEAVRVLPRFEQELLRRLDVLHAELGAISELPAGPAPVEALPGGLDAWGGRVEPIQEIKAVRAAVEPLRGQLDELTRRAEPIQEIKAVRDELEAVRELLKGTDD